MLKLEDNLRKYIKKPWLILSLVLLLGLIVRFTLLPIRWINPDEGSHMMGVRYMLEGRIPIADYGAREPLYLLAIGLFFKLFGISLYAGRCLMVLANAATGVILYFIGKKMFDTRVGLGAAIIYTFLPLIIFWAPVVKTEPLAALFASICILFLTTVMNSIKVPAKHLFFAGLFAAAAFYTRQPTISLPVVALIFFLMASTDRFTQKLVRIGWFFSGFAVPVLVVWIIYLNFMTLTDLFFSQLNPINLILNRLLALLGVLPESLQVAESKGIRILDQDVTQTIINLTQTAFFILPLLIGTIVSWFLPGKKVPGIRQQKNYPVARALLTIWATIGILLYGYQAITRGFFSEYGTEIFLPLVLLTSYSIVLLMSKLRQFPAMTFATISGLTLVSIYVVQKKYWQLFPGLEFYLILATVLAGCCFLALFKAPKKVLVVINWIIGAGVAVSVMFIGKILNFNEVFSTLLAIGLFVLINTLLGPARIKKQTGLPPELSLFTSIYIAAVIGFAVSGVKIGPGYDCVWQPVTLKKMNCLLKSLQPGADTVLSGAMIWQLESGCHSFLGVAHPTEFLKKKWNNFESLFEQKPPDIIIDDGYTQQKFSKYWDFLTKKLACEYTKIDSIPGSKFPIWIYKRQQSPVNSGPNLERTP